MDVGVGGVATRTTPLSHDAAAYAPATAAATTTLTDEANAPRLIIKMETIEPIYSSSTLWRVPRTYAPLTAAERADYYKAYDPMTGIKIAATLSGLLTFAVLYVFYKAKCKRLKFFRRSSSDLESLGNNQQQQQRRQRANQHHQQRINNESGNPVSPKSLVHHAEDGTCQGSRINSESGRDTPAGSVSTHASAGARPHYYTDDREMPPWKIYAKELFLYGGPGLWRSASLKGSDPLLLVAQSSFDETFGRRSQLRTGSLSGSMIGGLTCQSRKTSVNGSIYNCRLQVPDSGNVYRHRLRLNGRQFTDDKTILWHAEHSAYGTKKSIPARSVSFRENEATRIERKRLARSRPGSLRTTPSDYCYHYYRPDQVRTTERSSFRLPRRHLSVREARRRNDTEPSEATAAAAAAAAAQASMTSTPQKNASIRIPAGFSRKISRSKSLHVRSSSLSNESAKSIRSRLSKIIRAKSSAGDPSSYNSESPVRRCDLNGCESKAADDDEDDELNFGLIDICVIQATPAASPCASIKSTFSGDSLELGIKAPSSGGGKSPRTAMTLRDRRRCFANMKGQTIDHDQETAIDPAFLAPPTSDFQAGTSSSRLASSASPSNRHLASSLVEVFHHQENSAKGKCLTANRTTGSSKSLTVDLFNSSPINSPFD